MRLPKMFGLLTASALLIGANSANALTLTLDDLGSAGVEQTIIAGPDGAINFFGTVGDFNLTASTGFGVPARGTPDEPQIDLSVQTNQGAKGTLRVTLEDTGLTIPTTADGFAEVLSDLGINSLDDGSVAVESFIKIGAAGSFESLHTLTSPDTNLVETFRRVISAGDTFDLRTVIEITHDNKFTSAASADANLRVAPVPVPAALPLFLTALVGLGFIGRQRRRQAA